MPCRRTVFPDEPKKSGRGPDRGKWRRRGGLRAVSGRARPAILRRLRLAVTSLSRPWWAGGGADGESAQDGARTGDISTSGTRVVVSADRPGAGHPTGDGASAPHASQRHARIDVHLDINIESASVPRPDHRGRDSRCVGTLIRVGEPTATNREEPAFGVHGQTRDVSERATFYFFTATLAAGDIGNPRGVWSKSRMSPLMAPRGSAGN